MKEKMTTVQLRSTIFQTQNIGYTPDNANKFRNLLMKDSKIYGVMQPGMPILGMNPAAPQYGMPWGLFKKSDDGSEFSIVFQPCKIDILQVKDTSYNDDTEEVFCDQCISLFTQILAEQGNESVIRIAYAPLYALAKRDELSGDNFWDSLLKKTVFDGTPSQDINLNFLLKRSIDFNNTKIDMNLLHNIFDGIQTKEENGQPITHKVLLFQLDLNSIPEKKLNLNATGVKDFFKGILEVKNNLIDNVTE